MKNYLLFVSALTVLAFSVNAQEMAFVSNLGFVESSSVITATPLKVNAMFPGGNEALATYLDEHLEYTDEARLNALEGVVLVGFIVQKDGQLSDFNIVETPHKVLSTSTMAVMEEMPEWIPAKRQGVNIASRVILPIQFVLN